MQKKLLHCFTKVYVFHTRKFPKLLTETQVSFVNEAPDVLLKLQVFSLLLSSFEIFQLFWNHFQSLVLLPSGWFWNLWAKRSWRENGCSSFPVGTWLNGDIHADVHCKKYDYLNKNIYFIVLVHQINYNQLMSIIFDVLAWCENRKQSFLDSFKFYSYEF
jgi:hypothetical protein